MKDIICSLNGRNKLDEAPGAYKDINTVMALQEDLCSIAVTLKPLASIKG